MNRSRRTASRRRRDRPCARRRRTGRPSRQARSLFDIQLADPSFETGHFLSGARDGL